MEFKKLTKNVEIPVLGIGTWEMGGRRSKDTAKDKNEILAIKTAIKLGMTHVDTAEMYGRGHAEELVGKAIKHFNRKNIFVTTKVSPENLRYDDVISSANASLKRLNTNYIDLYLIHGPNPSIPMKETMQALDSLVDKGLIKFVGVSNFSVKQMEEAQKATKNKIVANQVEYNLLIRNRGMWTINMETEILPYCQENNIMFIAYRPLAKGHLMKANYKILDQLVVKYNKTYAQIAINWLISKKNVVTIPKTSNVKHLKENLGGIGWRLDKEDIKKLDNELKIS